MRYETYLVNELRLAIKLKGKDVSNRDLTAGTHHLGYCASLPEFVLESLIQASKSNLVSS